MLGLSSELPPVLWMVVLLSFRLTCLYVYMQTTFHFEKSLQVHLKLFSCRARFLLLCYKYIDHLWEGTKITAIKTLIVTVSVFFMPFKHELGRFTHHLRLLASPNFTIFRRHAPDSSIAMFNQFRKVHNQQPKFLRIYLCASTTQSTIFLNFLTSI